MLAVLGFATLGSFMLLVMRNYLSAFTAIMLTPIIAALIAGKGGKLGDMIMNGLDTVASTAALLRFAVLYFGLTIEAKLFELSTLDRVRPCVKSTRRSSGAQLAVHGGVRERNAGRMRMASRVTSAGPYSVQLTLPASGVRHPVATDFGGVRGPVARGEMLPGDGDVGVDARGAGEGRGGDLGGELEECGAAGLGGPDVEVVQPLRQPCGADGTSRPAGREEPWRWNQGADGRVALAVRGDRAGRFGDGLGQLDGCIAVAARVFRPRTGTLLPVILVWSNSAPCLRAGSPRPRTPTAPRRAAAVCARPAAWSR
ncbi:hypothetical protein [Streptomyces sp. GESEQ-35]|uniref:hypothetical protein n=1 Tax=Streptomyces sp. GESEQ-35 TaxID=2812657 RepID=UPI001FF21309|nr:hypothetical protein [Streptomyces sp. GESEQ-35]